MREYCRLSVDFGSQTKTIGILPEGVSMLIIENIPDWMNDLHIRVANIPPKMNLLGKYSGETVTVTKAANQPDKTGRSVTNILVF